MDEESISDLAIYRWYLKGSQKKVVVKVVFVRVCNAIFGCRPLFGLLVVVVVNFVW